MCMHRGLSCAMSCLLPLCLWWGYCEPHKDPRPLQSSEFSPADELPSHDDHSLWRSLLPTQTISPKISDSNTFQWHDGYTLVIIAGLVASVRSSAIWCSTSYCFSWKHNSNARDISPALLASTYNAVHKDIYTYILSICSHRVQPCDREW